MIFEVDNLNNEIFIDLQSNKLYPRYYNMFAKYEYEGNGYCWEGHIEQILDDLQPELLDQIEFDPEAGSLTIISDDQKILKTVSELLNPIFEDLETLKSWISKANRDRIED